MCRVTQSVARPCQVYRLVRIDLHSRPCDPTTRLPAPVTSQWDVEEDFVREEMCRGLTVVSCDRMSSILNKMEN